jgi:hypothetical protein
VDASLLGIPMYCFGEAGRERRVGRFLDGFETERLAKEAEWRIVMARRTKNRWVAKVETDSTHPPKGLFTKKAPVIARVLASKRVSPKGPQSGMRMLTFSTED